MAPAQVVGPGCNPMLICFGQTAAGRLSTAVQHQEVQVRPLLLCMRRPEPAVLKC